MQEKPALVVAREGAVDESTTYRLLPSDDLGELVVKLWQESSREDRRATDLAFDRDGIVVVAVHSYSGVADQFAEGSLPLPGAEVDLGFFRSGEANDYKIR